MLEPVAGQEFDLIVSNPPFVITPRDPDMPTYEYRDGGGHGDSVVEHLVTHLGAHLAPGGIAQLLGNWEIVGDGAWTDRLGQWARRSGVDVWVVQRDVQDPAQYAETWARDGGHQAARAVVFLPSPVSRRSSTISSPARPIRGQSSRARRVESPGSIGSTQRPRPSSRLLMVN